MTLRILAAFLPACLMAGTVPYRQSGFTAGPDGIPAGWERYAARDEIAPRVYLDGVYYRARPSSLAVSGNSNAAAYGGWQYTARGVEPGKWYRLQVCYRTENVPFEQLQVLARLDWAGAGDKRAGQPDYAFRTQKDGAWNRISLDAPAPAGATAVRVQLILANAPQGTVWWDEVSLEPVAAPPPRQVRIASVNLRPRNTSGPEASVGKFIETIDAAISGAVDLIVLPEGITVVGNRGKYAEIAEPVPGPTTRRLGEVARRRHAYIVAGIYEREARTCYNTAVLIDREGRVVGRYRKVYLPREEIEAGLTPGSDYPVFDTDFGKLGMMICWDLQYTDPARALALRGAEIIAIPIWGGNLALGKARAIENQVFLVSSGYDYPTEILDPDGESVSKAPKDGTAAMATVDLNRRYVDPWLGQMRGRFMKEMRLDLPR